ncbi:dATP/dGTP pyrophosphohydrolase domain-containing protein [Tuwongella immobilis]|uniref:dATP/dGTP pyrophosphohydrolase domain-containing protein n=1 Tax=Tuwongella immobilis TaxID=692036 RepID=UPI0013A70B36|nr:dATP/dGTP pyrophosphohydrolase domain-containing protein [Tuwongella immobilis]
MRCILEVAQQRGTITPEILGHLYAVLLEAAWEWSEQTFGTAEQRGPKGALLHLEKESREAVEAIGTDNLTEELADCQILIWDAARRAGLGPVELLHAARQKLEKNMARQWPMPTSDQPVEHIREGEE